MDVFEIIQDVLCLTLFGTEIVEMADDLSHLLFSFASYSNFYAVVTILFCFITTAVLILRFNNDLLHFQIIAPPTPNTAQKRSMIGSINPFSIQLKDANSANLKDGFTLSISTLSEGSLSVFWGASINVVHDILQWPAQTVLDHAATGQLLQDRDAFLWRQGHFCLEKQETKEIHFDCPEEVTAQSLGYSPRQRYPVVVIATEAETTQDDSARTVIANFTMLHLKDSIVTQQSHIVGQFLKLSDDRVFNLQPVYVATDNASMSPSPLTGSNFSQANNTSSTTSQQSEDTASGTTYRNGEEVEEISVGLCDTDNRTCIGSVLHGAESSNISDSKINEENCNKDETELPLPETSDTTTYKSVQRNSAGTYDTDITSSTISSREECQNLNTNKISDSSKSTSYVQQLTFEQNVSSVFPKVLSAKQANPCPDSSPSKTSTGLLQSSTCGDVTNSESLSTNDSVADSDLDSESPECVVCQMNTISHVLLPCRHACICGLCFKKIDKCPMCRGFIDSYFTLDTQEDSESEASVEEQAEEPDNGFVAWFMNLNDRLNDYLGFT